MSSTHQTGRTMSGGFSLSGLMQDAVVAWRLLWSPQVPTLLKMALPIAALAYWLFPLDLLPGLPFDDIVVLLAALRLFVQLSPQVAREAANSPFSSASYDDASHGAGAGQTVDTTWRVIDDNR